MKKADEWRERIRALTGSPEETMRTVIGELFRDFEAAEQRAGGESKGPWPCTKCGNLVWGAHEDGGKLCPGHPERRAPDADRAAAVELMRELREAPIADAQSALLGVFTHYESIKADRGAFDALNAIQSCLTLLTHAAAFRGERSSGAEGARLQLQNAFAVVSLLKLSRGRMRNILETATAAMTHAEVRMTQDLVAQIDAAFNPDAPSAPKAEKRGSRG